ncbi:hypothetical protein BCR44DRAFT_1441574, partial [Catenaria anguillulae PL171]
MYLFAQEIRKGKHLQRISCHRSNSHQRAYQSHDASTTNLHSGARDLVGSSRCNLDLLSSRRRRRLLVNGASSWCGGRCGRLVASSRRSGRGRRSIVGRVQGLINRVGRRHLGDRLAVGTLVFGSLCGNSRALGRRRSARCGCTSDLAGCARSRGAYDLAGRAGSSRCARSLGRCAGTIRRRRRRSLRTNDRGSAWRGSNGTRRLRTVVVLVLASAVSNTVVVIATTVVAIATTVLVVMVATAVLVVVVATTVVVVSAAVAAILVATTLLVLSQIVRFSGRRRRRRLSVAPVGTRHGNVGTGNVRPAVLKTSPQPLQLAIADLCRPGNRDLCLQILRLDAARQLDEIALACTPQTNRDARITHVVNGNIPAHLELAALCNRGLRSARLQGSVAARVEELRILRACNFDAEVVCTVGAWARCRLDEDRVRVGERGRGGNEGEDREKRVHCRMIRSL